MEYSTVDVAVEDPRAKHVVELTIDDHPFASLRRSVVIVLLICVMQMAMSRAHRIGQQEVVNIYRFVTSKSVEDILERAKEKMNELSAILRFGAEELLTEEKNEEESRKKLLNMDIDEILERAEKVESKGAEEEQGNELLSAFKDALAPRAARNKKNYMEDAQPENSSKRKTRGLDPHERVQKRRKADHLVNLTPMIEGAPTQVRGWSYGNLSKKDAALFARVVQLNHYRYFLMEVKKFGIHSQIRSVVAEVGVAIEAAPTDAQVELFDALIDGYREAVEGGKPDPKGTVLDFFGVPVKAHEVLDRVQELQLLAKSIKKYKDPVAQFRLLMHFRGPPWSKGCGWDQADDARLLFGIHYYGFGNWEKIRLDPKLGLTRKIAPATLAQRETFLHRAPNLDQRASALLCK
ncbi:hypothetical protein IFM89_017408, partial [Coptis chinensis]